MKTSGEIIYQQKDTFYKPRDISPPVQVKQNNSNFNLLHLSTQTTLMMLEGLMLVLLCANIGVSIIHKHMHSISC
jgi:hypothetical protein